MDWRSEDLHLEHDHTECEKDWAELAHVRIINKALLEALERMVYMFGIDWYHNHPDIIKARAAIAQAKGERT